MLKAVASVRDEVLKQCPRPHYPLELVTKIFLAMTPIDKVVFVRYDTPPENPIWGEFTRWNQQPRVYAPFETIVEIRYAAHLLRNEDWLRFVVCKELCHSLEAPNGAHDVSAAAISQLVSTFSLVSSENQPSKMSPAFRLEVLAEVGALELLCPTSERVDFIAKYGQPDEEAVAQIAADYHLPVGYVGAAFEGRHIAAMQVLLSE